jgi:hypothetical protein
METTKNQKDKMNILCDEELYLINKEKKDIEYKIIKGVSNFREKYGELWLYANDGLQWGVKEKIFSFMPKYLPILKMASLFSKKYADSYNLTKLYNFYHNKQREYDVISTQDILNKHIKKTNSEKSLLPERLRTNDAMAEIFEQQSKDSITKIPLLSEPSIEMIFNNN